MKILYNLNIERAPRLRTSPRHGGARSVSGKQAIEAAAGAPPRGRRHQSLWGYGGISPHYISWPGYEPDSVHAYFSRAHFFLKTGFSSVNPAVLGTHGCSGGSQGFLTNGDYPELPGVITGPQILLNEKCYMTSSPLINNEVSRGNQ